MLESVEDFSFNGEKVSELFGDDDSGESYVIIKEVKGRGIVPAEVSKISVPGRDGQHLTGVRTDSRLIEIDMLVKGTDYEDLRERIDELSALFYVKEPTPIVFDDEPYRTYFGVLSVVTEKLEINHIANFNVIFECLDPYKYGPERTISKTNGTFSLNYGGTANADSIIELTAREPSTFALVQNMSDVYTLDGDEYPRYVLLGEPYNVDDNLYQRYERVFYSDATSLIGWTDGTSADIDGGTVSGSLVSNGQRFVTTDYGTGSSWHGPVKKASLSEPVQDFRLSAYVGFLNKQREAMVGRIEIYLLDNLGNAVCKMALKDTSAARANVFAEMRAGGRSDNDMIINEDGNTPGVWNNFSGRLEITREGNIWSAWVGVRNSDGIYVKRRIVRNWVDVDSKYMRPVAQVVIHMGAVGTHTPIHANSGISGIIVDKINQEPDGIPYIVEKDDVIRIDTNTGNAYINGVNANSTLAFGSEFYELIKGTNELIVHPNIFEIGRAHV